MASLTKSQKELVVAFGTAVMGLLASMAEANEEVFTTISLSEGIGESVIYAVNQNETPDKFLMSLLTFLEIMTEDNAEMSKRMAKSPTLVGKLLRLTSGSDGIALTACSILHHIYMAMEWFDHNAPVEGAYDAKLVPTMVTVLESYGTTAHAGPTTTLKAASRSQNLAPNDLVRLALDNISSMAFDLQDMIEHGSWEVLKKEKTVNKRPAQNGSKRDEDDGIEEDDDDDDDDGEDHEMTMDEIDADMAMVLDEGDDKPVIGQNAETLNLIVRDVTPRIISLARLSDGEIYNADSIQGHALAALNNISWTIQAIDFDFNPGDHSIQELWFLLGQRIWDDIVSPVLASDTTEIELATVITSLAWAVSRSMKDKLQTGPNQHQKFMALYHASKSLPDPLRSPPSKSQEQPDPFQGLGVKCIGLISRFALSPAAIDINREVGVFLITVLQHPETKVADMVEALNSIFDIYADKAYDYDEPVFWRDGFHQHLQDVLPKAKKVAKSIDKRKFLEPRNLTDQAVENLERFLKYKKSERAETTKPESRRKKGKR